MDAPQIKGFNIKEPIGYGECGEVFAARDSGGKAVAVKVFDGLSISRATLKATTARLAHGGWADGVLPLVASDFEHRPAYWVTALVADDGQGGGVAPRSLQYRIDGHPGDDSMGIVRGIAAALAAMHHKRVAHANLKPGNVFFDESGGVLLSDWAQGNMPGRARIRFTDAVLYQAPEQLRSPEGYLREEGYHWDVYAFGTLAFRLLTGAFPRCHEIFKDVVPAQGQTRRDDIDAELSKIAESLESQPAITWPGEPGDALEAGVRQWIERCLILDPEHRPDSMVEVAAGLDRVEQEVEAQREHERLLDQRRRASRRALHAWFAFSIATAAAVALGFLWISQNAVLENERTTHVRTIHRMNTGLVAAEAAAQAAATAQAAAEGDARDARESARVERETALARLRAARELGDRLFAWSIEQGHRRLPPLDGRKPRLEMLEASLTEFMDGTANIAGLEIERATARLQLAEVALAAGDAEAAAPRLAEAAAAHAGLDGIDRLDVSGFSPMRMARNTLSLALLQHAAGHDAARATFQQARTILDAAPVETNGQGDRYRHFAAILDFHEAKYLAGEGKDAAALDRLMSATKALNQLADERPDAAILRSELATGYLASAAILDGMDMPGDAREVRELAAAELRRLLEAAPDDTALMLELAGCIGAMAETAVLAGNVDEAMEKSGEATGLLDAVIASQPENSTAISRKAAQLGLRAGVLRDQGKSEEALERYDEGIRMLTSLHATRPDAGMTTYRLALLTWQKARMIGFDGDRPGEIEMLQEAAALLEKLDAAATRGGPQARQAVVSAAYLHGDLGHALALAGDKPAAVAAFTTARGHWKTLAAADPESEEFIEGLAWCERRLGELAE